MYQEINLVTVDRFLPSFLTQSRILGVRLFDLLIFLLGLPLLYRVLGLLRWLLGPFVVIWRRFSGKADGSALLHVHGSVRLLITAALIRVFVLNVDLPLMERQFWAIVRTGLVIVGGAWLLLLFNAFVERQIQRRFGIAQFGESVALLRLARRVGDVLVVCGGALVALSYFGVDPTAALAGLGIGGIAVALAAQKTLENVIGGFSLVFDKALRVGDVLKLGEIVGTVDQIGLRSTRIRTLDRSIVSVPNGQIATVNIETLSDRDKFWFRHVIGLRYETTPAQIRTIVREMRRSPRAPAGSRPRLGSRPIPSSRCFLARYRALRLHFCERLESLSRNSGSAAAAGHGNRGREREPQSRSHRRQCISRTIARRTPQRLRNPFRRSPRSSQPDNSQAPTSNS